MNGATLKRVTSDAVDRADDGADGEHEQHDATPAGTA